MRRLEGIRVRVAPAILTSIYPTQFTLIDTRVRETLRQTGHLSRELSNDPTIDEYLLYLGACKAIATEYDLSLHALDMALWALGE